MKKYLNIRETWYRCLYATGDYDGSGRCGTDVLTTFGITQERFKAWFNLKECKFVAKRKKWLNGLFSWKVKNK